MSDQRAEGKMDSNSKGKLRGQEMMGNKMLCQREQKQHTTQGASSKWHEEGKGC